MRICLPALFAFVALTGPARAGDDWLPLVKGNYWVYRGTVKWTAASNQTKSDVLTCRMEITDVMRRQVGKTPVVAASATGYPADLSWYEPGKPPSENLILRVGDGDYYLFSGEEAAKALAKLRGPGASVHDLVDGGDRFIAAPLKLNKRYDEDLTRIPPRPAYCWVVETEGVFTGKGVQGIAAADRKLYKVAYRTNPDHTILGIVPGVGIVSYVYNHHGTVAEADLKLVESGLRAEK